MVRHHAIREHPAAAEILLHPHEHPEQLIEAPASPLRAALRAVYLVPLDSRSPAPNASLRFTTRLMQWLIAGFVFESLQGAINLLLMLRS